MSNHAAEQGRRLRVGATCLAVTTLIGAGLAGWRGGGSAAMASAVALFMQLLAAHAMRRTGVAPTVDHLMVYGFGVILRMLGVAVLAVMLIGWPERWAVWPAVLGYLGSVLPLLVLEIRLGQ